MTTILAGNTAPKPVFAIVRGDDGSLVHQTPEQLHPGHIVGDSPAAEKVRQGFKSISTMYADANAKRVAMAPDYNSTVKGTFDNAGRIITEARDATKAEVKELGDKLAKATGFNVDATAKSYVLGTFQSLSPNEKINAVNELIAEGHGAELAILASTATVFTGLQKEVRDNLRNRYFAAKEPALFAQLQAAESNLARIEAASITNAGAYAKFAAPLNVAEAAKPEVHRSVAG